jgi:hypothetical protein
MTMQLELFRPKKGAPKITPERVEVFVERLERAGTWVSARALEEPDCNDRAIRAMANASGGRIISGQRGYKAASCADCDEIAHAANWLEHQAREMTQRAAEIRRAGIYCRV